MYAILCTDPPPIVLSFLGRGVHVPQRARVPKKAELREQAFVALRRRARHAPALAAQQETRLPRATDSSWTVHTSDRHFMGELAAQSRCHKLARGRTRCCGWKTRKS